MEYPEVKLASKRGLSEKEKRCKRLAFPCLDFKHFRKNERSEVIQFSNKNIKHFLLS